MGRGHRRPHVWPVPRLCPVRGLLGQPVSFPVTNRNEGCAAVGEFGSPPSRVLALREDWGTPKIITGVRVRAVVGPVPTVPAAPDSSQLQQERDAVRIRTALRQGRRAGAGHGWRHARADGRLQAAAPRRPHRGEHSRHAVRSPVSSTRKLSRATKYMSARLEYIFILPRTRAFK